MKFLLIASVLATASARRLGQFGLENTCTDYTYDPDLVIPKEETSNGKYSCCTGNYKPTGGKLYYGGCETSSCVVNFGKKNLNCFNFGSPQHPADGSDPIGVKRNGQGGSANCPYAAEDKAICDVEAFTIKNGGNNCRLTGDGQNHCLGYVKCNTNGVDIPTGNNNGHSDGTSTEGGGECANSSMKAGEVCFYNGNSENWKVCDNTELAQTDEEESAEPPIIPPVIPDPTLAAPASSGAFGDPHVRTFSGEHYSFHGACDLVLVHNPGFADNLGMDIHIRNAPIKQWSYIDAAVLKIGHETLEVRGGENTNEYYVNGVLGNAAVENGELPETIAGYPVKFQWLSGGRRSFTVDLGNGETVVMKTFKWFIRVNIKVKNPDNFKTAVGLMGTYPEGKKVARDGVTEITDYDQFGQEWQVQASEGMMFHAADGPQAPQQCVMPVTTTQRRLAESSVTLEDAEIACAHVDPEDRDECIFDVLATEDKDMAGAY